MIYSNPNKVYYGKEICSIDPNLFNLWSYRYSFFVKSDSGKTMLIADPSSAKVMILDKDCKKVFSESFKVKYNDLFVLIAGVGWYDGAYYVLLYDSRDKFIVLKISEDGKLIGELELTNPLPTLLRDDEYKKLKRKIRVGHDYYARFTTARGKPEFVVSLYRNDLSSVEPPATYVLFFITPDFEKGKVGAELLHSYIEDEDYSPILKRSFVYKDNVYAFSIIDFKKQRILIDKINIFNKHLKRYQIDLSEINKLSKPKKPLVDNYSMPYIHKGKPFVAIVAYEDYYNGDENLIRTFIYIISLEGKPSVVKRDVKIYEKYNDIPVPIIFAESNDVAVILRNKETLDNKIFLELEGTTNILLRLDLREGNEIKLDYVDYGKIDLKSFDIDLSKIALIYFLDEDEKDVKKRAIVFDKHFIGNMIDMNVFY